MNLTRIFASMLSVIVVAGNSYAESFHDADRIQCSFTPEVRQRKSMQATCSGNPEKTFSTRYDQHSATEHCESTPLAQSEAYREFKINVPLMVATWKHEFLADPDARDSLIQRSMEKNDLTKEEAEARYEENMINVGFAKVTSVQKVFDQVYQNPITEEFYDPPHLDPALIMLMTTTTDRNFSVYISATNDAVLSEYVNGGDHSWINMSFGRCSF